MSEQDSPQNAEKPRPKRAKPSEPVFIKLCPFGGCGKEFGTCGHSTAVEPYIVKR